MKEKELLDAVQMKNLIISKQVKRIHLLEEKFTELRRRYFQLKHKQEKLEFHLSETF